jgi:Flp pilus assembly CpaE family ATPase
VKWFLSSQYPLVSEAINRGCSIYDVKAKSELGSQIDKMAQKLMAEVLVPAGKI